MTDVLHVLPAFGTLGVCADYDADCAGVEDHAACWVYDRERGVRPFVD